MSKAEERALEKYPAHSVRIVPARGGGYYADRHLREGFIEGYHQAEKDLELTWEDIREIACLIDTVRAEVDDDYLLTLSIPKRIENEHREYKEVLKRFKEWKERNEK